MSIDCAYDFSLSKFWTDRAIPELSCDVRGRRYLLRPLDDFVLFRLANDPRVEHTFFTPFRGPAMRHTDPLVVSDVWIRSGSRISLLRHGMEPSISLQEVFAEQLARGDHGMVAVYSCPEARDCSPLLFFRLDGTGFFLDYDTANGYRAHVPEELLKFTWEGRAQDVADGANSPKLRWSQLDLLGREIFTAQIWPRMKDPFIRYMDLLDMPLVWKCGSQEELFRITHCIFHTQSGEWSEIEERAGSASGVENHCIHLKYVSEMGQNAGGAAQSWSARMDELCKLAFQHNTFAGYQWVYERSKNKKRRKCYTMQPFNLITRIAPPSAHERAESLLTLWDWLEDKVSETERRAYLGLEE